jgi:lysophospholipase L1-like esterase
MLQTAKVKHIDVLLVNMPLTPDNLNLLPAPTLARYNQTIKNIAAKYQAKFLDWQQAPEYDSADFIDSCHLNARGGAKFYMHLADAIHSNAALPPTR